MRPRRRLFPKRDTPDDDYLKAAGNYHRRAVALLKRQKIDLKNSIAALSMMVICATAMGQQTNGFPFPQLPTPPPAPMFDLGKQVPYMATVNLRMTQTVTTVYSVKCLRVIDREGDKLDTNYSVLRTNFSVSVTNTSALTP